MKKILFLTLAAALVAVTIAMCSGKPASRTAAKAPSSATYHNPVIAKDLPDPSVFKASDGYYYVYSTRAHVYRSRNLVDWTYVGEAFSSETTPLNESWWFVKPDKSKAVIWAPDVNKIGRNYVMYYAMGVWGDLANSSVCVAVADSPMGPFKTVTRLDASGNATGVLVNQGNTGVINSIDPCYYEEKGRKYLFWGSFRGIYYVELTSDGLNVKQGSKPVQVAGSAYEGIMLHKHGKYYYMFGSTGSCCRGAESTYRTVVGRSESLLGPYVDPSGKPMLENNHKLVIEGNAAFAGTGHNSELVTDDAGNTWILYHAYKRDEAGVGRMLLLDRVRWIDGWPVVQGNTASTTAAAPVFKRAK